MTIRTMVSVACVAATLGWATGAHADPHSEVERGRYLATQLAGCAHCHTGPDGRLSGRSMGLSPAEKAAGLAESSAPIAGLPAGRTAADVAYLLQHAAWPGGAHPRAPMPPYTLHKEDADAITAYLASLKR